jgi:hypothetical protein
MRHGSRLVRSEWFVASFDAVRERFGGRLQPAERGGTSAHVRREALAEGERKIDLDGQAARLEEAAGCDEGGGEEAMGATEVLVAWFDRDEDGEGRGGVCGGGGGGDGGGGVAVVAKDDDGRTVVLPRGRYTVVVRTDDTVY